MESEQSHSIFNKDPLYYKSLVNNVVEVETSKRSSPYKGVLYTIDPVSESIVLLTNSTDSVNMEIIMSYTVKSIKKIESKNVPKIPENLFKEDWARYASEEELGKKRVKLLEWLVKNSIPIEESGKTLKLKDMLTIEPPYGVEQCLSGNEMVLEKIQGLIRSMPQ